MLGGMGRHDKTIAGSTATPYRSSPRAEGWCPPSSEKASENRERLREWRMKRGLSLRQLGESASASFVTLYRIEAGKLSPTVAMLEKLAKALDINLVDFFPPKRKRQRRPRRQV